MTPIVGALKKCTAKNLLNERLVLPVDIPWRYTSIRYRAQTVAELLARL